MKRTRKQPAKHAPMAAWTKLNPPNVGDWFILKASYCGGENPNRTKDAPCEVCLSMSNKFVIAAEHYGKDFFFGGGWCNRDGGHMLNETYSAVLTFNREIVNGICCIHHVSEAQPIPRPIPKPNKIY